MTTKDKIQKILKRNFVVHALHIQEKTSLHATHKEARKLGGGHFELTIVSDDFAEKKLLERHKMVYDVLQKEIGKNIHALAIKAMTVKEYKLSLRQPAATV